MTADPLTYELVRAALQVALDVSETNARSGTTNPMINRSTYNDLVRALDAYNPQLIARGRRIQQEAKTR